MQLARSLVDDEVISTMLFCPQDNTHHDKALVLVIFISYSHFERAQYDSSPCPCVRQIKGWHG
jgi:hypothetical protein